MFIQFSKYRKMTREQLAEVQELTRIVNHERFKLQAVAGNTALVPKGQELAKQLAATLALYTDHKNRYIAQLLSTLGYPQGAMTTIDLVTGKVTIDRVVAISPEEKKPA